MVLVSILGFLGLGFLHNVPVRYRTLRRASYNNLVSYISVLSTGVRKVHVAFEVNLRWPVYVQLFDLRQIKVMLASGIFVFIIVAMELTVVPVTDSASQVL